MDFFSKSLTAKDYRDLDQKGCIPLQHRKLDSILKNEKYWIIVIRSDQILYEYVTADPHALFRFLLAMQKADGAFNNLTGAFTEENIDEEHNKAIADLMLKSNVIMQLQKQHPQVSTKTLMLLGGPDEKLASKQEYDHCLKNLFAKFDKAQSVKDFDND